MVPKDLSNVRSKNSFKMFSRIVSSLAWKMRIFERLILLIFNEHNFTPLILKRVYFKILNIHFYSLVYYLIYLYEWIFFVIVIISPHIHDTKFLIVTLHCIFWTSSSPSNTWSRSRNITQCIIFFPSRMDSLMSWGPAPCVCSPNMSRLICCWLATYFRYGRIIWYK